MIKISHITKIYKSKNNVIKALDDVSFVLPNKGMVFIVGKSGSGKSTLLNSIGTLDKVDQGDIYFNNLNLTKLNNKEASAFRNETIGFMFQDFCLIEDLSVYQNIALALEIQGRQNNDYIDTILKKLDLYDFKNTKVIKLSVGQKERVAIARAMIKKPKVILCDEPTGNLDSFNSEIILDYLKELSKDILVIVITHNLIEAYKYADRVIELNNGKIIKDLTYPYHKKEALKLGNTLYLNELRRVNSLTKLEINREINKGEIKDIKHIETLFVPTDNKKVEEIKGENIELNKNRIKFFKRFKWQHKFFKKEYIRNFLYTLISALLVVAFSLSFTLVNKPGKDLSNKMMKEMNLPLYNVTKISETKAKRSDHLCINEIKDEEKKKLGGTYFPLSNYVISHRSFQNRTRRNEMPKSMINFERFYASSSYGTLYDLTREDVLKIFDDPEVYIEEVAPYKKEGVYLTDYAVDAYRFYASRGFNPKGEIPYPPGENWKNGYCNGVIHTNYKNKYNSILKKLDKKTLFLKNIDPKEIEEFVEFASRYLAISYSFEGNFNEYLQNPLINDYQGIPKSDIKTIDEGPLIEADLVEDYFFYIPNINDDPGYSMTISIDFLNKNSLEKKSVEEWNEILKGRKFLLRLYETDLDVTHDFEVSVNTYGSWGVRVSKDLLLEAQKIFLKDYALYFSSAEEAIKAINTLNDDRFRFLTLNDEVYNYIDRALSSFSDFFSFFMIVLFIASVGIIILIGTHNVKALKYKIGILKGIGISSYDLYSFYVINIFYILILFMGLLFPFMYLFNDLGNKILLVSVRKATNVSFLNNLVIFSFTPSVILIALSIMILSLTLSILVSLIRVNKIKPIDILKRI